jgi:hypothetical protein
MVALFFAAFQTPNITADYADLDGSAGVKKIPTGSRGVFFGDLVIVSALEFLLNPRHPRNPRLLLNRAFSAGSFEHPIPRVVPQAEYELRLWR